jgi:peptidyl-prolyl cis-trans isomerase C
MPARDLQALVDQYVREEALFRESRTLGLADDDYVIRRRMVQKMQYLIDDATTESFSPSAADLEAYFEKHRDRYEVAPSITFTHVFVDGELKREGSAKQAAERLKQRLEAAGAGFADAPSYGDRFPYLQNYVDRTPDYIESQFGPEFTAALLRLDPSSERWQGPIESPYGYHLVMLTQHKAAYLPELSQVVEQVKDDLLRDTLAARRDQAVADLVREFDVKLEDLPGGSAEGSPAGSADSPAGSAGSRAGSVEGVSASPAVSPLPKGSPPVATSAGR